MQNLIIYFLLFIFLLYTIFFAFIWKRKWKYLSTEKKKYFYKKLNSIKTFQSSKEKIIDCDKLYHKILLETGYKWDFWYILKQKPVIISNIDKIWELHKIRNSLVHDFLWYEEKFLDKKSNDFLNELEKLLQCIK